MNPQIPEVIIGESLTRVTPTRLFGPHDTFLTAVAYSDDGQRLVTGDIECYLRVWETETGQLLARRRVFNSAVLGAVFNRTNPGNVYELTVASTGNDVTVLTLGADHSISEAKALTLDTFRVLQIAYNAQNRPLIACIPTSEYDKRVYLMYGDDKAFIHAFNLSNDEYPNAAFSFDGNIYGASFFMATGFHGAHVIIGTIFLFICYLRVRAGHFTPENHVGFEAAAWYWHFVDVVWLFLFAAIYVWGG
ncbi:MAG: cytochrome c oxidase subunit 3 [Chloroflexota bacterium]